MSKCKTSEESSTATCGDDVTEVIEGGSEMNMYKMLQTQRQKLLYCIQNECKMHLDRGSDLTFTVATVTES